MELCVKFPLDSWTKSENALPPKENSPWSPDPCFCWSIPSLHFQHCSLKHWIWHCYWLKLYISMFPHLPLDLVDDGRYMFQFSCSLAGCSKHPDLVGHQAWKNIFQVAFLETCEMGNHGAAIKLHPILPSSPCGPCSPRPATMLTWHFPSPGVVKGPPRSGIPTFFLGLSRTCPWIGSML